MLYKITQLLVQIVEEMITQVCPRNTCDKDMKEYFCRESPVLQALSSCLRYKRILNKERRRVCSLIMRDCHWFSQGYLCQGCQGLFQKGVT